MAAQGVTALITGANRGLGLEMVRQLVECDKPATRVFACCRDPKGARAEALQTLAKKHPNVTVVRLDATDLSSIKECAVQVGSMVGAAGLNLLVNNAGVLCKATLLESTAENMRDSFDTNVVGPMNVIKEFLPLLRTAVKASKIPGMSSKKAAVFGISSLLGSMEAVKETYGIFPAIPYRISKASLNMLTVCVAEELKNEEILFAVLHPGWVRTDMGGEEGMLDPPESVQGMLKAMASMTEKQNGSFLDYEGKTVPW